MKPKIISHMISSVDGRLRPERYTPLGTDADPEYVTRLYAETNKELDLDGWMIGRATVQELAFPQSFDHSKHEPTKNIHTHKAARSTKRASIVFDPLGQIEYTSNKIMGDDIIVVLSESVSDAYLTKLRENDISYLFAGSDGFNLARALEELNSAFGMDKLLLGGGATLNGAFLKAGFIDELLIMMYPGIDGHSGVPSIFEYIGDVNDQPAKGQRLEFIDVEKMEYGLLYLRYRFHKL